MVKKMVGIALVALSLSLAGCGDDPPEGTQDAGSKTDGSTTKPDSGETCEVKCGLDCCEPGQVCKDGVACCTPSCEGKECGSDGCGGSCGECEGDETCNASGQCETPCVRETNEKFCERLEKNCGSVTAPDNCGVERQVNCGVCPNNGECDLTTNTCKECEYEGDNAFCYRMGKQCGPATGVDNCEQQRTVEECGPCAIGEECKENGICGTCTQTSNEEFCQAHGAECGSLTATECGSSRTVDCEPFGGCTGDEVCENNRCVIPGAPDNDNCPNAQPLNFVDGVATVSGSTALAGDDEKGGCGSSSATAKDVVYSFTIDPADAPKNAFIAVTNESYDAIVYVTQGCPKTQELACEDDPENISLPQLAAGTYYVWVDGYSSGNGTFDLRVELTDPPPVPGNDTCVDAVELQFGGSDTVSVPGTTLGAFDDDAGTCGAMDGGDVYYWFEIPGTENRSLIATVTPSDTTYRPAVYIRSGDCTNSTQVACNRASSAGSSAVATALSLAPGIYYAIVDGVGAIGAEFTLDLQLGEEMVLPEDCTTAQPLVFVNGTVTVSGDTSIATADNHGSCGSSSTQTAPDLVYSFTVDPSEEPVDLEAVLDDDFDGMIYLTNACPATGDLACSDPGTITARRLPAGTYYIWVDGWSSGSGTFSLTVEKQPSPPPTPGDTCDLPGTLNFTASGTSFVASASGDTRTEYDDAHGTCDTTTGKDVVYMFDTTGMGFRDFRATVTFGGTNMWPHLYLRTDCASPDIAHEVVCATRSSGGPMTIEARLPEGVYYLWVDTAYPSDAHTFDLDVTLAEPPTPPDNDECTGAIPLTFTDDVAEASGTTVNSNSHSTGTCGTMSGGDVVYQFEVPAGDPKMVIATVTRASDASSSFSPAVYIRSDCGSADAADEHGCGTSSSGTAVAGAPSLDPGIYYVVVDSTSATAGEFNLRVTMSEAQQVPDVCTAAEEIDLSSGSATVSGNTLFAANDTEGLCNDSPGPDVVYFFQLQQPMNVEVSVDGEGTDWVLYVRDDCGDTTEDHELACADEPGAVNARETVFLRNLAAGTYWIWVDGYTASSKGAFTLSVTATEPPPVPDNDTCAAPTELTFVDNMASVTGQTLSAADDYQATCGTADGSEVVYLVNLAADSSLQVAVTALSPTLKPSVYLRSADCEAGAEVACSFSTTAGGSTSLLARSLAAGPYYLFVDGNAGSYGDFALEALIGPPMAVPEDCTTAQPLWFRNGVAVVTGDTTNAVADNHGSCGSSYTQSAPDLVYSFTIDPADAPMNMRAVLNASWDELIYVTNACPATAPASELACDDEPGEVIATDLAAGTYYVWVDGWSSAKGPFTLTVELFEPLANDGCSGAEELTLVEDSISGDMVATVSGTTTGAYDSGSGYCGGSGGADVMYSFETSAEQTVGIVVTPAQGSTLKPIIHLRATTCDDAQAEVPTACESSAAASAGGSANILVPRLPQGTYYLWVDGQGISAGAFDVTVTTRDPDPAPENDVCDGITLDLSTLTTTIQGDTTFALDSAEGSCGGADSPDVVYSFTIPPGASHKVTATVTPSVATPNFDPKIYLRSACTSADTADQIACGDTTVTVNALDEGTYFIIVDGDRGSYGAFDLTVTLEDPFYLNDTCNSAFALTSGVPHTGDTNIATNDYGASHSQFTTVCQDALYDIAGGQVGPDLVYTFTPTVSGTFTVEVDDGFDSSLWVSTVCDDVPGNAEGACLDADDSAWGSQVESVTINGTVGTTYYIFVDSYSTTAKGTFTITVTEQ
ncbi:MAG: hypothetical protein ACOX6T_20635 [Myxococcales bacterium]|jgi:hypothetical protein